MRKVRQKGAVLEVEVVTRLRAAAATLGPMIHAFVEWLYTNGARASEPGLASLHDVDLASGTVLLHHLKAGQAAVPLPLSERCREALGAWLKVREQHLVDPKAQRDYLFPSQRPSTCYPCRGSGKLPVKKRNQEAVLRPCPHCRATGTRWGLTRHEAYRIIQRVFVAAGLPTDKAFPHVFRHSAATHMLDKDINPAAIQERLGHRALATTLSYIHSTKRARADVNKAFDEE